MSSFWTKVRTLYQQKYYTTWSNVLFGALIVALIIFAVFRATIPRWISIAVCANMVAVGILGAAICAFFVNSAIDDNATTCEDIGVGNFFVHVAPLMIAFILLFMLARQPAGEHGMMLWQSLGVLLTFAIIWSLVPSGPDGAILFRKMSNDYLATPLALFLLVPIIWIVCIWLTNRASCTPL